MSMIDTFIQAIREAAKATYPASTPRHHLNVFPSSRQEGEGTVIHIHGWGNVNYPEGDALIGRLKAQYPGIETEPAHDGAIRVIYRQKSQTERNKGKKQLPKC